jgi:hypothetical protein
MKKKLATIFIIPLLTLMSVVFIVPSAQAADSSGDVVLLNQGGNVNAPVFDGDVIAPGGSVAKIFTVKNTTDADWTIDLFSLVFDLENQDGGDISEGYSEFMHDMHVTIADTTDGTALFDGDAATLVNNSSKDCTITVPKGGEVQFKASAALDFAATNAVQGLSLRFDMILHCTAPDSAETGASPVGNPKTSGKGLTLLLAGMLTAAGVLIALHIRARRA